MKVRITKAPKLNRYQALFTDGQITNPPWQIQQNPMYVPNTADGQRNYVNATVGLNPKAPGVGTVLQPGLMPDVNNKMVNVNNVNDNITNETAISNGLSGKVTEKGKSKFGNWLDSQKGMAAYQNRQNIKDVTTDIASYERKADADKRAVDAYHNAQHIEAATQGTFGVNSMNNITPGMLGTVPSTGDFTAAPYMPHGEYGGQFMAYGGRVFNQIAPNALPDDTSKPLVSVQKTLQPVPRDQANIEAEKDETIYFLNNGGLPAHYKIGGQPHSRGGTPLNVPEDSFVYSKALKLKNKNLFEYFNISSPTSFADIAKKYDINKYRKILADPDTDKLQRETAEKMIANYNLKLGMLALAQESTKGFPQGLPQVGIPFTVVNAIDPQMILPTPPPQMEERAQQQQQPEEEMMEQQSYKYGGNMGGRMRVRIKSLPAYQSQYTTGDVSTDMFSDAGLSDASVTQTPPANIPMVTNPPVVNPVVVNPPVVDQSSVPNPVVAVPPAAITMQDGTVINTATGQPTAKKAPAKESQKAPAKKAAANSTSTSGSTDFNIDVMEGNPDFWTDYQNLVKNNVIKSEFAIGFEDAGTRKRENRQGRRPGTKNVYGDRDIHKGDLYNDFKKRHAWYFKDHPNWNYESKTDVKDFQKSYCKRAAEYGVKACYFNDKDIKDEKGRLIEGTEFDGRYGEHTFNAPGFNEAEKKPELKPEPEPQNQPKPEPIKVNPLDVSQNYAPRTGYFPQDLINLSAALSQRITVPDTWYAPLQFTGVDPAYLVPDYSPIMEAANISTQGINAYGSRQSADASLSRIQGQSARPAAEHNLAVANANAGIYNNAAQINAQIANQNAMYNNTLAQTDFDARQLYEQDRIKAQNKKRSDLARLVNAAITNKAMADTISDAYSEHFYIDPREGGRVNFLKGSPFIPNDNADMSDIEALDKQLTALNYSAEDKKEIIKAAIAGKYATNKNKNSYLPDYSQLTYPFNMQSDV